MPRSNSSADLKSLKGEYGSNAAVVRAMGYNDPKSKEYKAAIRAVQRATTTTGKQQHKGLSGKYAQKARTAAKPVKVKERQKKTGQRPDHIRVKARIKVQTDTRRQDPRGEAGQPGRWISARDPENADLDLLARDPQAFWEQEFGADFAEFDLDDFDIDGDDFVDDDEEDGE